MDGSSAEQQVSRRVRIVIVHDVIAFAALRLCHVRLLWADEDYHLAAALDMLAGKLPYRDFWYDKPPLTAFYYLLIGAHAGSLLRLLDMAYVILASYLIFKLARRWWGEAEGLLAAGLLAFFLTFYLPSAVISFAVDALMLAPHIAAIYFAVSQRAFLAGLACAAAFLANAKALFVIAVCLLWSFALWPMFLLGLALPLAAAAGIALWTGCWNGYSEQVWRWGWIYAAQSPVSHPVALGFERTVNWLGFHAALTIGTAYLFAIRGKDQAKLAIWIAASFAGVCLGTRFAPHYYLQLLPAMVVAASAGIVLAYRRSRRIALTMVVVALCVPLVRFGPRFARLAYDNAAGRNPDWTDVLLDLDSRAVAKEIRPASHTDDTLFVWGYRPDIYVYSRMISDSLFSDSQPLTGVPADRHLQARNAIYSGPAAANRRIFIRSKPTWFVDGLGLLNPELSPQAFPQIRSWMANYRLVGRTKLSLIYHRQ